MTSFYTLEELQALGFASLGKNVLLSRKCSVYGAQNISIGDDTRIDDFCILSGKIIIGSHVHIAAYVGLFGGHSGIVLEDFVGVSSRGVIYAESDDYSGAVLTNPTVPDEFKHIVGGQVRLERHAILGSGCTVMPGVTVGEGTAVGSMSFVNRSLEPWSMYVGIPCRKIKDRRRDLLAMEQQLRREKTV
ncbi:acyltransferase [uncultured Subdoligranulum sp.]|uniref:acyltransferase n=1 Tax=uncultured Subdoligranulum sp. TaxID=512298 RepID=UPI0032096783